MGAEVEDVSSIKYFAQDFTQHNIEQLHQEIMKQ